METNLDDMRLSIESLGWMRVKWSGMWLYRDTSQDWNVCGDCEYQNHALVLGWWVYRWRVWRLIQQSQ